MPDGPVLRFDGESHAEGLTFVEAEDGQGHSINLGEWRREDDGDWLLDLSDELPTPEQPDGGLAFERDLALRQARLAEAALKIVKWSLNENRPLRALDATNNELERLDEELDGLEQLGEARDE